MRNTTSYAADVLAALITLLIWPWLFAIVYRYMPNGWWSMPVATTMITFMILFWAAVGVRLEEGMKGPT